MVYKENDLDKYGFAVNLGLVYLLIFVSNVEVASFLLSKHCDICLGGGNMNHDHTLNICLPYVHAKEGNC